MQAAASGNQQMLRIALSDDISPQHLSALLALCREEEPDVTIRLYEVPLSTQHRGLLHDLYDTGFARSVLPQDGVQSLALWQCPLVIVVPTRHPLLEHKQVPLADALNYPLVLFHPETQAGLHQQIGALLKTTNTSPKVAEHVNSMEMLLALVTAGYGVGVVCAERLALYQTEQLVVRPLAGEPTFVTTFLLRPVQEPGPQLCRFIERAGRIAARD